MLLPIACLLLLPAGIQAGQGAQKAMATSAPVVDEGTPPPPPHFITKPANFSVVRGDTVRLPCHAVNTGNFIQAWKKDIAVLTAGSVKVTPDSRIRLVGEEYDLEIRKLNVNDSGEYVCQVAAFLPVEITHNLTVKVPPAIEQITSGGLVEVKRGTKVLLECKSSGIPAPIVTWTRKNNLVVAGAKSITGPSLTINQTTRHHAGVYVCTADNGVPNPVAKEITVNILYPPEIEVERSWVHSGIGSEAQLVCIVHAYPSADVRWYTDSMRLENTEKIMMENRGSRYSLYIRGVTEADFTNYTCQADNSQGKTKEHIVLSGIPHAVVFRSPSTSQSRDSFNISWTVNSLSPIETYRLYYRKLPVGVDPDPSPPSKKAPKKYNQWPTVITHKEWTEVVVSGEQKEKTIQIHEGHFLIRRLEPKTEYEAKAQAKNRFGWGRMSDIFKFKTKGMDGISLELTPEPAYQNSQESPSPRHLEAAAESSRLFFDSGTLAFSLMLMLLTAII